MSKEINNMGDKYYIPDISEFHIGFEFELKDPHYDGREDFQKTVVLNDNTIGFLDAVDEFDIEAKYEHLLSNVLFDIINKNIRVKYLDKVDIESLGFEYDNNAEPIPSRDDWNVPKTTDYELPTAFLKDTQLKDGKGWYLYLYKDNTVWIEYIKDSCGMGYIFKGIIKNKSELKKLLKQLRINESIQENNKE